VRKTNFHQISVHLFHHQMKHHKSGIYAIPFAVIYTQCASRLFLPSKMTAYNSGFAQVAACCSVSGCGNLRKAAGRYLQPADSAEGGNAKIDN